MPGYDGSGPLGKGPNGRGLGPCGEGNNSSRRTILGFRRGRRGGGRGFRWLSSFASDEKTDLQSEKTWLSQQLDLVNQRLNEINED